MGLDFRARGDFFFFFGFGILARERCGREARNICHWIVVEWTVEMRFSGGHHADRDPWGSISAL